MSDLELLDSKYILSNKLMNLLNAKIGDKLVIGFCINELQEYVPIIQLGEGGNRLNKNMSVSFRGKQRDMLAQYGTKFDIVENTFPIQLKGNNPDFKVFTTTTQAVKHTIDKATILDNNFDLKIYTNYEF